MLHIVFILHKNWENVCIFWAKKVNSFFHLQSNYVTIKTGTDPEIKLRQAFELFDEDGSHKLAEE